MNSPCARCKKTVYPVEKFNCLDKVWHKRCFTCETCNLKLTMKTYKGYHKLPYCNAHYPTTKFTAVADSPEALRLAKQQKNQSEVQYRKDKIESMKGFTPVADSVANKQATQAARLASSIGYQQSLPAPSPAASNYPAPYQPPPSAYDNMYPNPVIATDPSLDPNPPFVPNPSAAQPRFVALYDYTAGDDDEVSFIVGDIIVDATPIDDGWMEGRNSRTGQYGMLPSNYVQLTN